MPMGVVIWQIGDEGVFVLAAANDAASRIVGIDYSAHLGEPMCEFVPTICAEPFTSDGETLLELFTGLVRTGDEYRRDDFDFTDPTSTIAGRWSMTARGIPEHRAVVVVFKRSGQTL